MVFICNDCMVSDDTACPEMQSGAGSFAYGSSALLVKVWEFNEWFRVGREYSYIQNTQENACLEIYAYDMKNGFFKLFLVTTC